MYSVILLPHFKKALKPLVKKHPSLKETLIEVLEGFDAVQEIHLGNDLYKVRLATKEIKRGKSKSFRIIVLSLQIDAIIVPVTIYFKGDRETLSAKEINHHLEVIQLELSENRAGVE